MSTIQNLFQQAQLAEAAYANFQAPNTSPEQALRNLGFSQSQASAFVQRYQVVNQYTASGGLTGQGSGFSATLFLDTTTGQYTFAARGTEPGVTDLLGADFGNIVMDGLAMDQIVDMYIS